MRGASFRPFLPALVLTTFCCVTPGASQTPDYDLSPWVVDSEFSRKAARLFGVLTLQISHHRLATGSADERVVLGGTVVSASSFGETELSLVKGKAGVLPAFVGSIRISPNLSVSGLYSGFSSQGGDVVILSRYGLNLLPGGGGPAPSRWVVNVHGSQLGGPDDFFFKTVGGAVVRQINYRDGQWWLGIGSDFYKAGIHVNDPGSDSDVRDRLQGQVNSVLLGLSRKLGAAMAVDVEARVHPYFLSIMIGVYRIIG